MVQQAQKQLYYPNGTVVPVRDVWDIIDQLGYALVMSTRLKKEAVKHRWVGDFGMPPTQEAETIAQRNRLAKFLITNHGDKMIPQARYTLVSKEMNEKQRYYRKGEHRLFTGAYSSLVVELGITPDELDIDPQKFIAAYTLLDDAMLRKAATPEEKRDILKNIVHNNKEQQLDWV